MVKQLAPVQQRSKIRLYTSYRYLFKSNAKYKLKEAALKGECDFKIECGRYINNLQCARDMILDS